MRLPFAVRLALREGRSSVRQIGVYMASITLGVFQGYLKDRIAGPIPYALAEAAFVAALFWWFASLTLRGGTIRGPGHVPALLLVMIVVPALYLKIAPGVAASDTSGLEPQPSHG